MKRIIFGRDELVPPRGARRDSALTGEIVATVLSGRLEKGIFEEVV
jgi:hypothetical protein